MFLPLKDLNPTERLPVVTIGLIALNVVVFLYELSLGPHLEAFVATYGATPFELTHGVDLVRTQGDMPAVHTTGSSIPFITVFTSMFIHGGFLHIFGNMLYLWIFGNNVEDLLGPVKFLFFYFLCGTAAAAAHVISQPNSAIPTVGASGAIAGVLGAYLVAFPRARVVTLVFLIVFIRIMVLPASFLLVFWFIMQAFSGFASLSTGASSGGVAWFAHVGGFAAGAILIRLMAGPRLAWIRQGRRGPM
jgi:membrane associated rhomboid family serine protease